MKLKANVVTSVLLVSSLILFSVSMLSNNKTVGATSLETTASSVKTITASGVGTIEAIPDVAYVNIGVVTENKDLSKAQTENATKMNKVMSSLKDLGIKESEIKTTNYSVNPKYNWDEKTGASNIIGYSIYNTVEVTINDINKTDNLLDEVVASGSNNISGINFGVKDESSIYNQALELAVKDAKAKATAMGKGLSLYNLTPVKVSETSSSSNVYYEKNTYMDAAAVSTPISQGTLEISANVSVDFSFQ